MPRHGTKGEPAVVGMAPAAHLSFLEHSFNLKLFVDSLKGSINYKQYIIRVFKVFKSGITKSNKTFISSKKNDTRINISISYLINMVKYSQWILINVQAYFDTMKNHCVDWESNSHLAVGFQIILLPIELTGQSRLLTLPIA